jgi:hypothetical protein
MNISELIKNPLIIFGAGGTIGVFWNQFKSLYMWKEDYGKKYTVGLFKTNGQKQSLYFFKGRPIWFIRTNINVAKIRWIRWTISIQNILKELTELQQKRMNEVYNHNSEYIERFFVRKLVGIANRSATVIPRGESASAMEEKKSRAAGTSLNFDDLYREEWEMLNGTYSENNDRKIRKDAGIKNLWMHKNVKSILDEINYWAQNRNWFLERGIAWKRGYALIGNPGNGKTSFIRAIGMLLDLPVLEFNLASMDNKEFLDYWFEQVIERRPCIAAFEDIDTIFDGRKNITGGKLTFETILSCMDGLYESDGLLIFITANNPKKFDPAMCPSAGGEIGTRPGRIDKTVYFPNPDKNGLEFLARKIMLNLPENYIKNTMRSGHSDSADQFRKRCMSIAENYIMGRNHDKKYV